MRPVGRPTWCCAVQACLARDIRRRAGRHLGDSASMLPRPVRSGASAVRQRLGVADCSGVPPGLQAAIRAADRDYSAGTRPGPPASVSSLRSFRRISSERGGGPQLHCCVPPRRECGQPARLRREATDWPVPALVLFQSPSYHYSTIFHTASQLRAQLRQLLRKRHGITLRCGVDYFFSINQMFRYSILLPWPCK